MSDDSRLAASYDWCRNVARSRAKNFYYSFLLLDAERRASMCAVYAFMRVCDDLSDDPGPKTHEAFTQWRRDMERALQGDPPSHDVWPAFADTAQRYRIPPKYFHDMIDGVESDIDFRALDTFDELYTYCYRVASVVGLTIVHILGFEDHAALSLAEKCGVAFQLTNILRDIREDYDLGRVYLPSEDLVRFKIDKADLGAHSTSTKLRELLSFEAARARQYYRESAPLAGMVSKECRPMLRALIRTYSRLLDRIESSDFDVLSRRISLPVAEKLWILAKAATQRA